MQIWTPGLMMRPTGSILPLYIELKCLLTTTRWRGELQVSVHFQQITFEFHYRAIDLPHWSDKFSLTFVEVITTLANYCII